MEKYYYRISFFIINIYAVNDKFWENNFNDINS